MESEISHSHILVKLHDILCGYFPNKHSYGRMNKSEYSY
jgi:hypothetical protein